MPRELGEGCSGNNDVLHEGSPVGQKAKDRFGRRGDGGPGHNLCLSWELGGWCLRCLRKEKCNGGLWKGIRYLAAPLPLPSRQGSSQADSGAFGERLEVTGKVQQELSI